MTNSWLFFPTASSSSTGWRDEADHVWQQTVTSEFLNELGNVPKGCIGYNGSANNFSSSYTGTLRPYPDTFSAEDLGGGKTAFWWTNYSNYQGFAIDWSTHASTTSGATSASADMAANAAAFAEFETAHASWDLVLEFTSAAGAVVMRRIRSLSAISDPDFSAHLGASFYWNSGEKLTDAEYEVGLIMRLYLFNSPPTSSDWNPGEVS